MASCFSSFDAVAFLFLFVVVVLDTRNFSLLCVCICVFVPSNIFKLHDTPSAYCKCMWMNILAGSRSFSASLVDFLVLKIGFSGSPGTRKVLSSLTLKYSAGYMRMYAPMCACPLVNGWNTRRSPAC